MQWDRFIKTGARVVLKARNISIPGTVVSYDDDSDTQIANVEDHLTIRTDEGKVLAFQGSSGCLRPHAKALRKYGRFYVVPEALEKQKEPNEKCNRLGTDPCQTLAG